MVLPFLDYCDIFCSDRNNKVLMDSLQVLQNRAAKIVLDRPAYSSSTQALLDLKWEYLRVRRRLHRFIFVFKCLNGLLDYNYNFTTNCQFIITKRVMPTSSNVIQYKIVPHLRELIQALFFVIS